MHATFHPIYSSCDLNKYSQVIDDLHIKNHKDPKCLSMYQYDPKKVREKISKVNLMCAKQTFAWLSRYKKNL